MDNPNSQQQIPQPSTRNIKNLSIKEFFTNRLMRTRSFEGGSPKDETSNWFDEFKARMSKKSQASSVKAATINATHANLDESNEENSDTSNEPVVRFSSHSKTKRNDATTSTVKDTCNNSPSEVKVKNGNENPLEDETQLTSDTSFLISTSHMTSFRERKLHRVSCVERPDFDTASINTIFNRRDSRYDSLASRQRSSISSKIVNLSKLIISYLIPFNYTLPWKVIAIINFTFVFVVIGLTSHSDSGVGSLTFFNGFLSGLLAASICFIVLITSLLVKVLPRSSSQSPTRNSLASSVSKKVRTARDLDEKSFKEDINSETSDSKPEDYSSFEVLDCDKQNSTVDYESPSREENPLEDDDYKGWMIEFIGDYELRNKSDIKLKLIFVRVENRILHLCKPKSSHDVDSSFPSFVSQRTYDLKNARKFNASLLIPKNVRNLQKWVWSKKYPISLSFQIDSDPASRVIDSKEVQLTLFAKSCREKEEWFRRFKRIVEENRLSQILTNKRVSIQSEASIQNDSSCLESIRQVSSTLSSSPMSKKGCVLTSQSSHILNETQKLPDEDDKLDSTEGLVRTKSCEQINIDQSSSLGFNENSDVHDLSFGLESPNDSTLTRETAELFSQSIDNSNFMESRPNLDYRDYIEHLIESSREATSTSDWFNALTGRIFFDVLSHSFWSFWFKRKIQRKLRRIRLPYFMETLTLTKIDLGENAPQFLNVVSHTFDSFGLSIDFDMSYSGGLTMTFETKLNLLKIKADNSSSGQNVLNQTGGSNIGSSTGTNLASSSQLFDSTSKDTSSINDSSLNSKNSVNEGKLSLSSSSTRTSCESSDSDESDSDSSSDSSSEQADVDEISDWEDYGAEKTRQSIVRFVDKIASSRYFQHATENRYIKKKLQDISNCPLVLVVKIESLNGVLTLNVPPPQTDRVWYGFKPNPELTLKALPKMGDREVNLSHVTDWIEKKLEEEFRKILVIPNMEDIVLSVLKSDHLAYVTSTK